MFVPSFLALWWPKIDRKSGFPQLFAKTVGSIHFIPGIYTYGVSLWTPIDFRVRALIFGPLVAKNWPKIGVSATFRENCRLDSFHPWDLYLWGKSLDPYRFSCSCPHFWPSGGQKLTENRGFRNFSRKLFLRFPNFLYQLQPRYLPYHDTLVGRVMPKFFSNKFFLNDSHQCSYHNDLKIGLFVGYFLMGWVLIRAGVYCPHLWAQLVWNALSCICYSDTDCFWVAPARRPSGIKHMNHIQVCLSKSKLNWSAGVQQEKQTLCDHKKKCAPLNVTLLCHFWMLKILVAVIFLWLQW